MTLSGGCQCGAVRFSVQGLGRGSICHCRMCQKATGGFAAPYVTAKAFEWTRGAPAYFHSSNKVRRGFCANCGTPLSFEPEGGRVELSIGAFDAPVAAAPTVQVSIEAKLAFFDGLCQLPPAMSHWNGIVPTSTPTTIQRPGLNDR